MENWREYLLSEQPAMMDAGLGGTEGNVSDPWEEYKEKLRTGAFRQPWGNNEADTIDLLEKRCQKGNNRSCEQLQRMKNIHAGKGASKALEESNVYGALYDIISILDPTRLTAYPSAGIAINNFKKEQNWHTATILTLSLLAIIPVIGNFAKAAKVASKIQLAPSQTLKVADTIATSLKKASHAPKIAGYSTKLETARGNAQRKVTKRKEYES